MLITAYLRDEGFLQRVPLEVKIDPKLVELDQVLDDSKRRNEYESLYVSD